MKERLRPCPVFTRTGDDLDTPQDSPGRFVYPCKDGRRGVTPCCLRPFKSGAGDADRDEATPARLRGPGSSSGTRGRDGGIPASIRLGRTWRANCQSGSRRTTVPARQAGVSGALGLRSSTGRRLESRNAPAALRALSAWSRRSMTRSIRASSASSRSGSVMCWVVVMLPPPYRGLDAN
jgi:hypothetical protein